jgi:hypothetical protein
MVFPALLPPSGHSLINSWLLYRRVEKLNGNNNTMTLEAFRAEIAECLCHFGQQTPKRNRPSTSLDGRITEKKKKQTPQLFHQKRSENTKQRTGPNM